MKPCDGCRSVPVHAPRAGMAAFKRLAGLGRRFPFARELTLALLFKMIMLWGLWALFFRPDPDAPKPSRPAVLLSANPFSSPNQEALKP